MGWTGMAQDRDKWRAFMDAVMDLWVSSVAGEFFSDCKSGGLLNNAQL
jgi:hypothetical protein